MGDGMNIPTKPPECVCACVSEYDISSILDNHNIIDNIITSHMCFPVRIFCSRSLSGRFVIDFLHVQPHLNNAPVPFAEFVNTTETML